MVKSQAVANTAHGSRPHKTETNPPISNRKAKTGVPALASEVAELSAVVMEPPLTGVGSAAVL